MLVVPPLGSVSLAQVACALLAIALTGVAVYVVIEICCRMRIAKALAPIPGPKGWFLLGILPTSCRTCTIACKRSKCVLLL